MTRPTSISRTSWAFAGLVLALAVLASPSASAQTPEELAERCIAQIRTETAAAIDRAERVCDRTIDVIRQRLREGNERGAHAAAREGAERIGNAIDRAGNAIANDARECMRQLRRAGASREIIRTVRDAAERAANQLETSERRCYRSIRSTMER